MTYKQISKEKFKHYPELQARMTEAFIEPTTTISIVEGEVIGMMIHAGPRIIALVIKEEYRRLGHGTDFINYHLHSHGAGSQEITAAQHDSATLAFLFSQGFRNAGTSGILYDHRPTVKRLVLRRSTEDTFPLDNSLDSLEVEMNTIIENVIIP